MNRDTKTSPQYKLFGNRSYTVTVKLDLLQWALFLVALITRLWRLDYPRAVVFDEIFFGRFSSMYFRNMFHFDTNPPLGKMLFAMAGYLGGYDGKGNFDGIGTEYHPTVPIWYLRLIPALSGSFLVLITYQIIITLGYRASTAAIAAFLVITDNALLTQSRFMMLEIPLIFAISLATLSYIKFKQQITKGFSRAWWCWLTTLSVSIAMIISIKYVGLFTVLLLFCLVVKDFWNYLPQLTTLTTQMLWREFMVRVIMLLVLPCILYTAVFYVHLSVLYKAGPHDDMMTSSFQASLEGGLSSITKHQPIAVAYGSQITLRHTFGGQPCWLHSHKHVYPIRYSDTRGSSHQQQVTCYTFKDTNNWWIVKDPMRRSLTVDDPVRPVKHGDVIQLIHGLTSRTLNSHDVAAPVSPQYQEVSCYIDYNVSFPAQDLWRVELTDSEEWRTIESHVRLVHLNTSQALKLSGRQLPDWGFHQLEVVSDKNKEHDTTIWNVEEHKYTRMSDSDEMEREITEAGNDSRLIKFGFWQKFWELQKKILTYSKDAEIEHRYSSNAGMWPLMEKNVAYWYNAHTNAQIHLLGNPSIWVSVVVSMLIYGGLLAFYMLRRHRQCYDIEEDDWSRFGNTCWLLLGGYLVNYIPYYMTDHTLFLYHYLPALYFSILLTATLVEHVDKVLEIMPYIHHTYEMLLLAWLSCILHTFYTVSVFSYGMSPLSNDDIKKLTWRDTWDFLYHN